jgi:DNA-binding response OmpR family regulator
MMLLEDVVRPGARLTHQEAIVAREILDRGEASRAQIIKALWGHRSDGGPLYADKAVEVIVCRLRKKIDPSLRVKNRFATGWSIVHRRQAMQEAA